MLAWTELGVAARRGNKNFSNIILFDIKKGERKKLTNQTKYFSPAISPDGQSLVAIHISPLQENRLHVLDIKTGNVVQKIDNPNNLFLSRPAWTPDGKAIVCVAKRNSELSLVKFDLDKNAISELLPWTAHVLDVPYVSGGKVFFTASFSGIDNIYFTDLNGSKNVNQVTSVPIGAFDPTVSPDGKEVTFTEFTDMGYVLSKQAIDPNKAKNRSIQTPGELPYFKTVANEEEGGSILGEIPTTSYETESYKGLLKGLKLHSWGVSPSNTTPAIRLEMANILNDLIISAGGGLNLNEGNASFYDASVSFARWFPVISLNASLSEREADFYSPNDTLITQNFDERLLGGNISLPLSWLSGNYATSLSPSFGLNFRDVTNAVADPFNLPDNNFGAYDLGLSFNSIRRAARQNVGPRAGIAANVFYTESLEKQSNEKITAAGTVYLPGLMPNHNIKITGGYQKELLSNPYQYSDTYQYPRGYETPVNDDFTSFSINYGLPLFYPDLGIANITYFQRIRANLFYDMGKGSIEKLNQETDYRSAGFEIIFDNTHLTLLPISFGLRQSFLLEDDPLNPGKDTNFSFFVASEF